MTNVEKFDYVQAFVFIHGNKDGKAYIFENIVATITGLYIVGKSGGISSIVSRNQFFIEGEHNQTDLDNMVEQVKTLKEAFVF